MKRYFAAAGALLLSTSTVALAADVKMSSIDTKPAADAKADVTATSTKPLVAAKSDFGTASDSKLGLASLESDLTKMASADTGAKLWNASATDAKFQTGWSDSGDKFALTSDAKSQTAWSDSGAKFQTASIDSGAKFASVDSSGKFASADMDAKLEVPSDQARAQFAASHSAEPKLQTASGDAGKLLLATGDKTHMGMGGPIEGDSAAALSLAPQPATQNYPACDPGPGDDRCIQLYEDGVRERLASWNRPTGGLLDSRSQTAMGGPFEPVGGESLKSDATAQMSVSKPIASDTSASADTGMSKPIDGGSEASAETAVAKPAATDSSGIAQHSEFTGVGGPVESQSGYPPCSQAGPGEDRCIQLYEAGVSGAGN